MSSNTSKLKISPLVFLLFAFLGCTQSLKAQTPCGKDLSPLFGLTTESVDDLDRLLPTLRQIKEKCIPTLRVVFQPGEDTKKYVKILEQIRGHEAVPTYAYILGLLVDSQNFHKYNGAQMRKRALKYANNLSDYVDIWEVGNEVNGDWVGWKKDRQVKKSANELEQMRKSVGERIKTVYDAINQVYKNKGKTPRFALNLYFNDDNIESTKDERGNYTGHNCLNKGLEKCQGECLHDYEMFTWADKYLKPQANHLKFDYVLFSFYRDDCQEVVTDAALWVQTFVKLGRSFSVDGSTPKVGFGEVAPQCYCSVGKDGKPKKDDDRRVDNCCRPEQPRYVRDYYQTLHQQINDAIREMHGDKPDYVGGFFYWYFYQDATDGSSPSNDVLKAIIESAGMWNKQNL